MRNKITLSLGLLLFLGFSGKAGAGLFDDAPAFREWYCQFVAEEAYRQAYGHCWNTLPADCDHPADMHEAQVCQSLAWYGPDLYCQRIGKFGEMLARVECEVGQTQEDIIAHMK